MAHIDPELVKFATPRQVEYIELLNELGSGRAVAERLGIHYSAVNRGIAAVKAKAATQGYAPECGLNSRIPMPYIARGHSTLERVPDAPIDPVTGRQQVLQWTKTRLDDQAWADAIRDGVEAFVAGVGPVPAAPPMPGRDKDVIPWIQIGDAHLGMLAHEAETGANFDLKIAERELCAAISILIDESGEHDRIVINDLGDFTHYENMAGVTDASGHALDYDGRFPKMIEVYSRVMRFIVDKALEKANVVDVIVNQGNHSRTNDIWMAELLRVAYAHTGRVNVLNNGSLFIGYRMGRTLVMTHHSDKCRADKLIDVMTTDFREDFGETEYHYIDVGHIHHNVRTKEHAGASIESWNTLAAKDKWATDGGYRARQSISIVERSRTYGEVGRRVLPIRRVRDVIEAAHLARGDDKPYRPIERRAFSA